MADGAHLLAAFLVLSLLFVILIKVHKVTTGGAIGTIIIRLIVIAVISAILPPFTGRYSYRYMMGGRGMMNSYNIQVTP